MDFCLRVVCGISTVGKTLNKKQSRRQRPKVEEAVRIQRDKQELSTGSQKRNSQSTPPSWGRATGTRHVGDT